MDKGHLLADIPASLPSEVFTTLVSSKHIRIERIVSKGHSSPAGFWYDQEENEWVLLIKGAAIVRFDANDRRVHLAEGDYVHILAHEKHRVEWTSENIETVWLAVFY